MKQLDQKQKAFVIYLAEVLEAKDSSDLDNKVQGLSQDELNQLTASFDTIYNQQMDEQTIIAQLGAKLDYIKRLNNKCPEGYEPQKFEAGGKTCIRCKAIQTKATGEAAWMKKGSKVVSDIKKEMCTGGKMKCGGKTSKKMEKGDKVTIKKDIQIKEELRSPKAVKNATMKKGGDALKKHLQGGKITLK